MTEEERKTFFVDGALFNENWNKFLAKEVLKYADEHVAYSVDGTRILAHGKTLEEALAALTAAGLDPEKVVWDQLPPADIDSFL